MKNNKIIRPIFITAITAISFTVMSCDKNFDEPPVYIPPDISANTTIKNLKAIHTYGSIEQISDDLIIEGIVVADDQSGNFYKEIVIEDTSGGITVLLSGYDLYTSYPVGRQVFIKLKGLCIGDYNRQIQLGIKDPGTNTQTGIASPLFDEYLIKGTAGNIVTPKIVTVQQLDDSYQSQLIQLDNFEFSSSDTSKDFATDPNTATAVNYTIRNCSGNSIILRNSSYASFANLHLPNGNGSIVAVYSVFRTDKQLYIRDTSDVKFYGDRCGVVGAGNEIFVEDFTSVASGDDISLTGWINVAEKGTITYKGSSFSGNSFAKISAYKASQDSVRTWLITPAIDLSGTTDPVLSFDNTDGYDDGATLKVYISSDYDGKSKTPWNDATWTQLNATISKGHSSGYGVFINSGSIDLKSYSAKIYIAFLYEGADPSGSADDNTTTFEIDNIKVTAD